MAGIPFPNRLKPFKTVRKSQLSPTRREGLRFGQDAPYLSSFVIHLLGPAIHRKHPPGATPYSKSTRHSSRTRPRPWRVRSSPSHRLGRPRRKTSETRRHNHPAGRQKKEPDRPRGTAQKHGQHGQKAWIRPNRHQKHAFERTKRTYL